MAVQARTDLTNYPFILSGEGVVLDSQTLLQDAGRTTALAPFTVMARVAVAVPTTGTAAGTNTAGSGTCTAVAPAFGGPPRVGTWTVECVTKVANGGVFKLTDPGGNIVANDLTCTVGAGGATVFFAGGLTFTITDATDFEVGDKFTIAVTAVGKWVPFDPAAVNGAQIPRGIFLGDAITAAALVAGDVTGQTILVGKTATIDSQQVVYENSATVATVLQGGKTVRDALAEIGIYVEDTLDIDVLET